MNGRRLILATLLIIIGLVLLGINTGYINPGFFWLLFNYWPVLLILLGIFIVFSRTRAWFIPVIITVIVVFAAIYASNVYPWRSSGSATLQQTVPEGTERFNLILTSDVGIVQTVPGVPLNITGNFDYIFAPPVYANSYADSTYTLDVSYAKRNWINWFNRGSKWKIETPSGLPLKAKITLGVGQMVLNLRNHPIEDVLVRMGIGEINLDLFQIAAPAKIDIDLGIGEINLSVPGDIPLRIKWNGGLASKNFKEQGLVQDGDYFVTPKDQSDRDLLEITISVGIGEVSLHRSSVI